MTRNVMLAGMVVAASLLAAPAFAASRQQCDATRRLETLWGNFDGAVGQDARIAKRKLADLMDKVLRDAEGSRDAAFGALNAIREAREGFLLAGNVDLEGTAPEEAELRQAAAEANARAAQCLQSKEEEALATLRDLGVQNAEDQLLPVGDRAFVDAAHEASEECRNGFRGGDDDKDLLDSVERCQLAATQAHAFERSLVRSVQALLSRTEPFADASCVAAGADQFGIRARLEAVGRQVQSSRREIVSLIGENWCERHGCPPSVSQGLQVGWQAYFDVLDSRTTRNAGVRVPYRAWRTMDRYAAAVTHSSEPAGREGLNLVDGTIELLKAARIANEAKGDWRDHRRNACGQGILGNLREFF